MVSKRIKKAEEKEAFILELTVVWMILLPPDGIRVGTGESLTHLHDYRFAHMCIVFCEQIYSENSLFFLLFPENGQKRWDNKLLVSFLMCVLMNICVFMLHMCVSRNGISVSAPLYNVSRHILFQIHQRKLLPIFYHNLWWLWVWKAESCLLLPSLYQSLCMKKGKSSRQLPAM